jgi:hypothetical protein
MPEEKETHDPQPEHGRNDEHRPPKVPPIEPPGRIKHPRPSHGNGDWIA